MNFAPHTRQKPSGTGASALRNSATNNGTRTADHKRVGLLAIGLFPPVVHKVLDSSGTQLDATARNFFEPRFRHDFSRVRVHADAEAATSARAVNALAYTVGEDVVFGHGQYDPSSSKGQQLLAHELTHVTQQSDAKAAKKDDGLGWSNVAQEKEASQISSRVLSGQQPPTASRVRSPNLARFSDTTHHVIEEAALPGAGFVPEQVRSIERGNVQRDYSQIGAAGNAALLGDPRGFGGYSPAEHFDNFIFDAVTNRWRTRGVGQQQFLHLDPRQPDLSPIDYISSQLTDLATAGMTDESLVHLGNAFHTVEDFFAHSNFIELTENDHRFGQDLVTGSFEDNPANSSVSLAHTLEAVSTPQMQSYYERQAQEQTQLTEPRSHSRLAKDTASSPGFTKARRLAALVIQELGADIIVVMRNPQAATRIRLMNEMLMTKIRRYLRPPDPEDRWWDALISRGASSIDTQLAQAERRTPVTVNQAGFSPLRNLEASANSSMAIPVGVAAPVGNRTWFQIGAGVTRPSALDPNLPDSRQQPDQNAIPFIGAQLTGHF